MKRINFEELNEKNEYSLTNFLEGVEMEFIKTNRGYLIKDSNGKIVSEEEKLMLEKEELILKDINGCNCQGETTKKISKIDKKLKNGSIKKTDTTI